MTLLDIILVIMQLIICRRLANSCLWASERTSTECIKVIYAAIGLSAVLTLGVVLVSVSTNIVSFVPIPIRMGVFTLLTLYSLISYHIIHIFDKRRITNKRTQDASTRSSAT